MLSKYVELGNKIEVYDAEHNFEEATRYYSSVYEIQSEDTLEIVMPMEKTRLILLSMDMHYKLIIYTQYGLYQCKARVTDRYKSNNMYIAVMELVTDLRKYQRRDYYRLQCSLDLMFRGLTEEEQEAVKQNAPIDMAEALPMERGIMVDMSGGGIRFVSEAKYESGSILYCIYQLMQNGEPKRYEVFLKVLSVRTLEHNRDKFEYRVKYYGIRESVREEIIKYIFQEDRKIRKKENY